MAVTAVFDCPLYVVQEIRAWEASEMVRRYAHLAPAHLVKHAEVIANLLGGTDATQRQNEKGLAGSLTP